MKIYNEFGRNEVDDKTAKIQLKRILQFCIRNNFTERSNKRDEFCRTYYNRAQPNNKGYVHTNNNITFCNANPRGNFGIFQKNNAIAILSAKKSLKFIDLTIISLILGGQIKKGKPHEYRVFFAACCKYDILKKVLPELEYDSVIMFDTIDRVSSSQVHVHWISYGYHIDDVIDVYDDDIQNKRCLYTDDHFIYPEFVIINPNRNLKINHMVPYNQYYPNYLRDNYNNYQLKDTVNNTRINRKISIYYQGHNVW
jgi:hypothetical protein